MNDQRIPDEILDQASAEELQRLNAAWESMAHALPEAASGRMKRRFRKTVRSERFAPWGRALTWGSMAACLVLGITAGRLLAPAPSQPVSPTPESALLSASATAVRLQAMVALRRNDSQLSADTRQQLGRMVNDQQASIGMRLAAVDTLAAHAEQDEVRELARELLAGRDQHPPLIRERLKELGAIAPGTSI